MFRMLLQMATIGIVALLAINVLVSLFPANEHAVTLTVVVAGTLLIAALRWGVWPFRRSIDEKRHDVTKRDGAYAGADGRRRIQLSALAGVLIVLLSIWALAASIWIAYTDMESRAITLQALVRVTAITVSVGILAMPPFRKRDRFGYQLTLTALLALGWFAGSILLPSICGALAGPCRDVEAVVLAVPGWSFVPVMALLLRSVGARMGVAAWRATE